MKNRVLLIAAGLAIPLVALAVLTQTATPPAQDATTAAPVSSTRPANAAVRKAPGLTLEETKTRVRTRIVTLQGMTPEQFAAQQQQKAAQNPSHVIITLEEARTRAAERLKALEGMTQEQFEQQQR